MSKLFVTDIDGVLLNFAGAARQYFADLYNTPSLPYTTHWNFEEGYGLPKKVISEMWKKAWTWELAAYEGAIGFLESLNSLGFTVQALSSRATGSGRDSSLRDLQLTGLLSRLDRVTYLEPHEDKGPVVKAMGANYFIDDAFKNVFNVLKHSPETKVFLMDQPWNWSYDLDPPYQRVILYETVIDEVSK